MRGEVRHIVRKLYACFSRHAASMAEKLMCFIFSSCCVFAGAFLVVEGVSAWTLSTRREAPRRH